MMGENVSDVSEVNIFAARDRYLTSEERSVALVAAAEHDAYNNVLGSYLGGSFAVGLGHGSSDIDVYVLVRDRSPRPARSRKMGEFRVEVKEVAIEELRELVAVSSRFYATSTDRSQVSMSRGCLKQLIDFCVGEDLQSCEYLARARRDISIQALRQILMSGNAIVAANLADDAGGAAEFGDWVTALECSGMAVRAAAEVVLAAVGDVYVPGKFVFRRLARDERTEWIAAEAWRLVHLITGRDADRRISWQSILAARLLFANSVVSYCLLHAWDGPLASVATKQLASWTVRRNASGPWRSPYFGMLRYSDGIGLSGPLESVNADHFAARVWSLLDGRSLDIVARDVALEFQISDAKSAKSVSRVVESLDSFGLVVRKFRGHWLSRADVHR